MRLKERFFTGLLCTCLTSVSVAQTPKYLVGTGEYNCFILNTSTHRAYDVANGLPKLVPGPTYVTAVAAALHHYAMLDNAGNMWCWGDNQYGEVGNGNNTTQDAPVQLTVDSAGNPFVNIVQVVPAASNYGYLTGAVKADGTVWVWGALAGGNRGNGSAGANTNKPVQVVFPAGTFIKKIQLGAYGMALDSSGNVWTWGGNYGYPTQYILARGTNPNTNIPMKISLPGKARDISGGNLWNYAILQNNSVYGWGYYTSYLGIGSSGFLSQVGAAVLPQLLDAQLNFPSPVKAIYTSSVCSYALLQDSTLWAWGDNSQGSIGNGVELDYSKYTVNPAPSGGTLTPYEWDWGFGELLQQKPVHIGNGLKFTNLFTDKGAVFYAYAEDAAGNLYSWGRNKSGVCGNAVVEGDGSGTIEAQYPNSWDIPWMTKVDPFSLTKVSPTSSPWCTGHSGTPCSAETIPVTANPTVSAGTTQNISTSTTTLNGSGLGMSGSIINYFLWTQVSGPSTALITLPSGAVATASGLVTGTYVFQLKVTDNNWRTNTATVTVNVNLNGHQNPVANAGADQTITLPTSSVSLDGSASSDPNTGGSITGYQWAVVSGPSGSTFSSATSAKTTLGNLAHGVYTITLTVKDTFGLTATDTVLVTVNPAPVVLVPLVAKAGADQSIQLPLDSVALDGSASTDPNASGGAMSYAWTLISGPSGASFSSAASAKTNLRGLVEGTYSVALTVSDTLGMSGSDTLKVTVLPAYLPPVAVAGNDTSLTLPANSLALNGSLSSDPNPGGSITAYKWTIVSGPTTYTIANANVAQTTLSGLVSGIYTVHLTVGDNYGLWKSTTFTVTVVNATQPLQPVTANAGSDQTIQLPASSVTLTGTGTDPNANGGGLSYQWSVVSGPTGSSFSAASSASTTLSGLVAGSYQVVFTVIDTLGVSASDTLAVVVKPAYLPPVAVAGNDTTIQLPANSISLNALASSDPNAGGSITTYKWTITGGPSTYTIANPNVAQTTLSNLVFGVYTVHLTVGDNYGQWQSTTFKVTVNAAVQLLPLVANAGANQTITMPVNSATLDGTGSSDPNADGGGLSYSWKVTIGQAGYTLTNANTAKPTLSGLDLGDYTLQLTITDTLGLSATATTVVTVQKAINLITANAGSPQTIQLPTNTVTLDGSGSADGNGTINSWLWQYVSGPTQYNLVNNTSAQAQVQNLEAGTYVFKLTVGDNNGNTASDQVTITVLPGATNAPVAVISNTDTLVSLTSGLNTTGYQLDGSGSYAPAGDSLTTYLWQEVSGPSTVDFQSVVAAQTAVTNLNVGTYVFELTVTDGAGQQASATLNVDVVNTSKQVLGNAVQIYPNPVHNGQPMTVWFNSALSGKINMRIFDVQGRLLQSLVYDKPDQETTTTTLDVNSLPSGTYFLQLQGDGHITALPFIKMN
jgi:alpha-tubulin suppressor-like RCC1 family protein